MRAIGCQPFCACHQHALCQHTMPCAGQTMPLCALVAIALVVSHSKRTHFLLRECHGT